MAVTNAGVQSIQAFMTPLGYTQVSTVSSAVGIGTVPSLTRLAIIQAESKDCRWRDDGTDPTASVGMVLVANDMLIYTGDMSAIKFIETSSAAKLNITFYR